MRKIIIFFFSLFLLVFLNSCEESPEVAEKNADAPKEIPEEITATACSAHWECLDENYKYYLLENCTRTEVSKCDLGCINGTCKGAESCSAGFKCIDQDRKGYQKEDCSFINKETCQWGCVDGKCNPKPANATNQSTASASPVPKNSYAAENQEDGVVEEDKTTYILKWGEQGEIESSGTKHNISIYNLEPEYVIVEVNDIKSDQILEGGNFTYGNIGITLQIKSILFQAYAGGKREIEYSIID